MGDALEQFRAGLDSMLDGFAMFRSVRDGDAIVDFEWRYVNAAGAATYGRPIRDVIGARMSAVLPGLKPSGMFDRYCAVVETGESLELVQLEYADEGAQGTFDLRAWRVGDGFAVTWRDVTERESAARAVHESEERFRASLEHLHEAVSVFLAVRDSDGAIADFRWTYANAAASSITGYTPSELEGRLLMDVLPHHGPSGMLDVYRNVVDTGEPYIEPTLWYEDVWGDGQRHRRAFDVRATKLHDGFVVVTREVTAEREREDLLARQRADLETAYGEMLRANEQAHEEAAAERQRLEAQLHHAQRLDSLGQLAGGIAHDFNNLLAAILNYSTFVAEQIDRAAEESTDDRWATARADVEQIRRAAERATALTRQLLAFGRREVVQPRVLDLNAVVGEVENLLRRTIGEHIELVTTLAPDLAPVMADPGQIEQVLLNVALNARDAMPAGGTLTIDTDNVFVDEDMVGIRPGLSTGPHVRLRVSDTGTGITPDIRARVFEPFFTTKPRGSGSGLGLATVYGIVTQAGGHAEIYSEPGLGATFRALFPAAGGSVPAVDESAAAHSGDAGTETVLVVEDEGAMREVTSRILRRNGYRVITAESGDEAVAAASAYPEPIDLLLSDVVMPQMLGKEVAERVRAQRPAIKVLFMSGYAHGVLASQGTLEPGVDLIEKPFSEPVLLAKIRSVIDGAGQ